MFSMLGELRSGQRASLVWHAGYPFSGDDAAVQAANDVIVLGEPVPATVEGPFFRPGWDNYESALFTATAAFERVLAVASDDPLPEYDGGVVDHGVTLEEPVQESAVGTAEHVWEEVKHPRDRLGRWVNVLPVGRKDEQPDHTKRMISNTLKAISKVHPPPKVPEDWLINIRVREGDTDASYEARRVGNTAFYRPNAIRLNKDAPPIALAHEIGHYLDHAVFGPGAPVDEPGDQFGSRYAVHIPGHPMFSLFEKLNESEAISQIVRSMHDDTPIPMLVDDEMEIHAPSEYFLYGKYLLDPWEMFARAYSQWIALRSGDLGLQADMEKYGSPGQPYPPQWMADDFEPIAEEFDKLFGTVKMND